MTKSEQDQHFREEFEILSVGTDEYSFTIPTIKAKVIDSLDQRKSYLDIGAGHGNLTRHFAPHFEQLVIVEPNPVLFQELMSWAKENSILISGHNTTWNDKLNIQAGFDFALISHVLYHIPPSEWRGFIGRAFGLLNKNGQLVIVTVADPNSEIGHLYRSFLSTEDYATIPYAETLVKDLESWGYKYQYIPFTSDIHTQTEAEMEELIDFLLIHRVDFSETKSRERLKSYIAEHLTKSSNYAIASPGAIISLKK